MHGKVTQEGCDKIEHMYCTPIRDFACMHGLILPIATCIPLDIQTLTVALYWDRQGVIALELFAYFIKRGDVFEFLEYVVSEVISSTGARLL